MGLDDRLAGEDGEEAVQSQDKASGGAEGEGVARRVSKSDRDNKERPGGMQRWGDGERERRRKARQEEAKREQRAEQDFMCDVSPTGGSGTRRSERQGHFERQSWQVLPASPLHALSLFRRLHPFFAQHNVSRRYKACGMKKKCDLFLGRRRSSGGSRWTHAWTCLLRWCRRW